MATNIKFTGMASGLDTESIVSAMVLPYKNKVDNSKKQETLLEWKKDAYKSVSSKVYNFYTKTASNLRLESTFNKKKLTASSNTAIELDNTSTINTGTHVIDKIKQMAESARIETQKLTAKVKDDKGVEKSIDVTNTTDVANLGFVDGDVLTFSEGVRNEKGELVTKKIAFVKEITDKHDDADTIYIQLENSVGVDGKITKEASQIKDLTAALKKSLPNSSVEFNTAVGAYFITSKITGENEQMAIGATRIEGKDTSGSTIAGDGKAVLTALGIKIPTSTVAPADNTSGSFGTAGTDGAYTVSTFGQSAVYSYNGIDNIKSTSNNVNIGGLKFTIKDTTLASGSEVTNDAKYNPITITSTEDIDGMVEIVQNFVSEYNTLISELNEMLNASSSKGYEPLTDEEKEAMSESEIEKWEKKIKDSLLRNDSTVSSLLTSLRTSVGGVVTGNEFKSLSGIGITTGSYSENGKLYLDTDKLKVALNKNADAVVQLLAGSGDPEAAYIASKKATDPPYSTLSEDERSTWENKTLGVFDRTYNTLKSKFNFIADVKSSTSLFNDLLWNKKITNQAKETDKWEDRLENAETMYYNKFTAMEKLMSQMNSQTSSITALLGGE